MAITSDWFPASRNEQLAMAKNWAAASAVHGMAWNVPETETQELAAKTAAKSEATRTPAVSAKCRAAFQTLKDKTRDIKKRRFHAQPLALSMKNFVGLKRFTDMASSPVKVQTVFAVLRNTFVMSGITPLFSGFSFSNFDFGLQKLNNCFPG